MKIVLLPGLDGTGELFTPLIDSLPSDCESLVITYPINTKMSYKDLVDFVMGQLPVNEDFILVGESFSGLIAYDIAIRKPPNLKSVIFVASFLSSPRPLLVKLFTLIPLGLLLLIPIPKYIIKKFLLGYGANEKLIDLFKRNLKKVPANIISYRLGEINKLSVENHYSDIRAIYIQATDDKLVPHNCVNKFKEVIKNLSIFKVDGSHFILQSNPVRCAEIIYDEATLKQ